MALPSSRASSSRTILDSPFLNLTTVEKALSTTSDPNERINLLSAKLHLLIQSIPDHPAAASTSSAGPRVPVDNGAHFSSGESRRMDHDIQVLKIRLELARAIMGSHGRMIEAEAELSMALRECKRLLKRMSGPHPLDKRDQAKSKSPSGPGQERSSEDTDSVRKEDDPDGIDYAQYLEQVKSLRIEGLGTLLQVEEALGRDGRAKRWRSLIDQLTGGRPDVPGGIDKG